MCLYNPSSAISDKPGWIQSDERMVEGLVDAGFGVVSCANNVNFGEDAILSSIRVLDQHAIAHTGTGPNIAAAHTPVIIDRRGARFGFLAYTAVFFPYGHAAGPDSPGVATIKCHTAYQPHPRVYELPGAPATTRSWPEPAELDRVCADIRRLRPHVDVLVTYFHWGVSGEEELAEYQQTLAHEVVDGGADLVVGSHAHLPQAVEVYRDRAIFYGLGNFAFDWAKMEGYRTGLVALCSVVDGHISKVSCKPVWRHDNGLNQPEILDIDHPQGLAIVDRVEHLSGDLGTKLTRSGTEVVVWQR
jgi:poly-gamma-glutamate synthesis protein (capsule biosynthesis protein)